MMSPRSLLRRGRTVTAATVLLASALPATASTLVGFASFEPATFAKGPTSGQFVDSANGETLPLINKQPVQGFSAVLPGPIDGSYYFMPDNGFGNKANSPDTLLRVYAVLPEFRHASGHGVVGNGRVYPLDVDSGAPLSSYNTRSFISLRDPDHQLGFALVADGSVYPYSGSGAGAADIPVATSIRVARLLTGADLDIESFRRDKFGHLWFGDEFGPFLIKTDATGKVLRSEVPMDGVMSPDNPYLGSDTATLKRSNGYEGMAINRAGDTLYTLLEGTVTGDPDKSLRISAFDVRSEQFTGASWLYHLDDEGTNIGDMTAVNDHEFLVIERNGTTAPLFKKIFLIDLDKLDADGFVSKTEVVDLMNVNDPDDLNEDGATLFTFPFVTIEDVLVLDRWTLLVANDNNYPGSSRTSGVPDPTEIIKIRLDAPLTLSSR